MGRALGPEVGERRVSILAMGDAAGGGAEVAFSVEVSPPADPTAAAVRVGRMDPLSISAALGHGLGLAAGEAARAAWDRRGADARVECVELVSGGRRLKGLLRVRGGGIGSAAELLACCCDLDEMEKLGQLGQLQALAGCLESLEGLAGLSFLSTGSGNGDDDGGDRFLSLSLCPEEDFDPRLGLEDYIGPPSAGDLLEAMRREHAGDARFLRASGEEPCAGAGGAWGAAEPGAGAVELVHPLWEWDAVVCGERGLAGAAMQRIDGRDVARPAGHYVAIARTACPELLEAEVVALRLWTGPMYRRYARFLRAIRPRKQQSEARSSSPQQGSVGALAMQPARDDPGGPAHYVTTLHAINSGILKLARRPLPPPLQCSVHRGLWLDGAWRPAGVDPCMLAFTRDPAVAAGYARRRGGPGCGVQLELGLGLVTMGLGVAGCADVAWLSQFPKQAEVLFPALSRLEFLETLREDAGGIYAVGMAALARGRTLEELGAGGALQADA